MYSLQRAAKEKNIPNTLSETIHSFCINKKFPTNSPGITYTQMAKQNSYTPSYRARETHKSKSSAKQ
jgi:hypothetical protein